MKKEFLLIIPMVCLIGCSSKNGAGGTKGRIDCYSIEVKNGGNYAFQREYTISSSIVYEYKDSKGNTIYTDTQLSWSGTDYITGQLRTEAIVRAYPNRYLNDYVDYTFSRMIGRLTVEYNYYYDLESRTIDFEIKWSEYKRNSESDSVSGIDNKEAYKCAKKNYYLMTEYVDSFGFYVLRLDSTESTLERHTYTQVGNDSVVTYKEKWF